MQTISEIKNAFATGALSKPAFIEAMYAKHGQLFEHADALSACNLNALVVTRTEIHAEFREPPIKMVCPRGDTRIAPIEAFNFGDFEAVEIQLVRKIVGLLGGASVGFLDIGANTGFYSLSLSHYYPGIKGIAFEPVLGTYANLLKNLELNKVTGVSPRNLGLSDKPGKLVFAVTAESGASFIAQVDTVAGKKVECEVTTLDDFMRTSSQPVNFIKCDVEGAELMVFKGGRSVLEKHRPVIFTEMLRKWAKKFGYHPNDIISLLAGIGYRCFVIRDGVLAGIEAVDESTMDTNFLFLDPRAHQALLQKLVKA